MKILKALLGYYYSKLNKYYNIYLVKKHNFYMYEEFKDLWSITGFCRITDIHEGRITVESYGGAGEFKKTYWAEEFITSWMSGRGKM